VPQAVAGRIQLARPDAASPATAIEILARGPAVSFLACSPLPLASAGRAGLLDRLLAAATGWLRPKELHAAELQLDVTGGITARPDNFGDPPTGPIDPLSKLVFTIQPSTTAAGQRITPPVVVKVQSGEGVTIPSYTGQVTVTIGTNPSGGTLSGYGTQIAGEDTFYISIDQPGSGYTLVATASGTDPTPALATSDAFDVINTLSAVVEVSARNDHTCGVTGIGAAYCWGSNNLGRLGNGTTTSSLTPVAVGGGLTFTAVSAGAEHTCGVTTGGDAYCWGRNSYGQLGIGSTSDDPTTLPVLVSGGYHFARVSAGAEHTCGITFTGAVYCWGLNDAGQLGDGSLLDASSPVAVSGGHIFASLSAGDFDNCAVTISGDALCWGNNLFGQLGNGTSGLGTDATTPQLVSGGHTFAAVSAGNLHTCGITTSGAAYCWGRNALGQLGDNTTTDATTPVPVSGGLTFAIVSAGRSAHTCGVTTGGDAYCWGHNDAGQLGNGSTTDTPIPVLVSGGLSFAAMSAGAIHTCAVTTSNIAYCWGFNFSGQLGDGTTTNSATPVPVAP
jgi:alpha-tubulin suppressor-like RCC1 family protein